jgi:hypothetical protein
MLQKRWSHLYNALFFLGTGSCKSSYSAHYYCRAYYSSKTVGTRQVKYEPLPPDWQAVIGVEIHAQLRSAKKLFSSAWTEGSEAGHSADSENRLVAPFDAALPGALPSLQREPLTLALRACLALECQIATTMSFDRKHYFYPDLPSGYQITQKYCEWTIYLGGRKLQQCLSIDLQLLWLETVR